jgi:hypothetical protein
MSDIDPTPLTPVTVGDRLGWWRGELGAQLAAQHAELLAALAAQHTALLSAQSTGYAAIEAAINRLRGPTPQGEGEDTRVDMEMLSAELLALRGTGPENNTLRSINQSLWNLAGPAPGRSLTDLYNALTYLEGGNPDILWTTAGLLHVVRLALYNSDRTLDAGDLLERINTAIGGVPYNSLEIASVRGLLNNIQTNTGNMAVCCEGMASNPLKTTPTGACDSPFTSISTAVLPVSGLSVSDLTVAEWDFSGTSEFEAGSIIGLGSNTSIIKTVQEPIDWAGYRFYVASKAQMFGAVFLDPQRYPTNQWVTLPYVQPLMFTVDGNQNDLKVYICPVSTPTLGACSGFPGPMNGPSALTPATLDGSPTTNWYSSGESFWTDAGFTVSQKPSSPQAGASLIPAVSPVGTPGDMISCCVVFEVSGAVEGLSIRYSSDLGGTPEHQFVSNSVGDGVIRATTMLSVGLYYTFQATVYTGNPVINVWVTRA